MGYGFDMFVLVVWLGLAWWSGLGMALGWAGLRIFEFMADTGVGAHQTR